MNRTIKRHLLLAISLAIGYGLTYLIVVVFLQTTVPEFWLGPEDPFQIPYFILVGFFIALAIGIWLDKFMKTEILPE